MTIPLRLPTTWWADRDVVVTQIAEWLYRRYSTEAVHEAVVSLLSRSTPPTNPGGYCARVAWRYDHGDAYPRRERRRQLKNRPLDVPFSYAGRKIRFLPVPRQLRDATTPLLALEAKETLSTLGYNTVMEALQEPMPCAGCKGVKRRHVCPLCEGTGREPNG